MEPIHRFFSLMQEWGECAPEGIPCPMDAEHDGGGTVRMPLSYLTDENGIVLIPRKFQ